jgi:hypothetical protein
MRDIKNRRDIKKLMIKIMPRGMSRRLFPRHRHPRCRRETDSIDASSLLSVLLAARTKEVEEGRFVSSSCRATARTDHSCYHW